jgi:hypothetical protein
LAYELQDLAPRKYKALISDLTVKYGRKKWELMIYIKKKFIQS